MAEAGSIVINLTTKTASFVEGMDKAGRALHGVKEHAEETNVFLERLKEGFGFAAGIELFRTSMEAIEKPLDMVKEAFEDVARIGRDALKFGVSAEDMSRFQHAANATGVDVGALEQGMRKLEDAVGKVNSGMTGSQPIAEAFAKLGIDAKELAQADPAETFKKVAEAMNHLGSAYDRAAVARQLLGRGGTELLPVMRELDELMEESDRIGFTRTTDQIRRAEEEERKLAAVTDQFKGMLMDIATSDFAMRLINGFKDAAEWAGKLGDAVAVLSNGNPAEAREGAERNRLKQEELDLSRRIVEAGKAVREGTDPDQKLEAQKHVVEMLRERADLERRMYLAGVAGASPNDASKDELAMAGNKIILGQLEEQAAAWHRLNAEKEHEKEVNDDVAQTIARLQQELGNTDKFGSMLEKLTAEGATSDQIKQVQKLVDQLREADKVKKEMGDFDSLFKKAQTPLEKYNEQMKELNDLLAKGKINKDQFDKAAAQAMADQSPEAVADKGGGHQQAALAARSFTFGVMGGERSQDVQHEIANNQKRGLDYLLGDFAPKLQQIWQSLTGTLASAAPDNVVDFS